MFCSMKNKYKKSAKISEIKIRQIIRLFAIDIEVNKIAKIAGVSRKTANSIVIMLRERIARYCDDHKPVNLKNSRIKCKYCPGCCHCGLLKDKKVLMVFGIIKHDDNVYTQVVKNCTRKQLNKIVNNRLGDTGFKEDGIVSFNSIVDFGQKKIYRLGLTGCNLKTNQLDTVETFWIGAKDRLSRFRGIRRKAFALHLKECEFRFNHRSEDIYKLLLRIVRNNPI